MPFREHVGSFTPEQLDAMAAALNAAVSDLGGTATEDLAREMAQRILRCAAEGVFSEAELRQAALGNGQGGDNLS